MRDAPIPLPPYAHAADPGDGFDIPVYNRAGEIIGYRQNLQALRVSDIESSPRLGVEPRPFREPIGAGAEKNLRLLLTRAGVFRDGGPDWAWAPLEQAAHHFRIGALRRTGPPDFDELVSTVLPDEFMGVHLSGRRLRRDCLSVSAFGMTYEIRDRFRYVAFRLDEESSSHIAEGAGWTREDALSDARRHCAGAKIEAVVATPGLLRVLGEHGFGGSLGICVSGFLAMLWDEVNTYEDEFWDYHGERLGWW